MDHLFLPSTAGQTALAVSRISRKAWSRAKTFGVQKRNECGKAAHQWVEFSIVSSGDQDLWGKNGEMF